ncbi:penicillin acylase family protein [Dehalococcoidia bacterium]|nr:penicillin acylase family protein [Dehalococcoidia bacterium]
MKRTRSRKILRIVLLVVGVVVVLALIGGYAFFYDLTRGPLPQHDGELRVAGLIDTVEILRDQWSIPHIYARNMYDLFFAQGFTQAQDRWWQMEFWRHAGSGRIGELVGKSDDTLQADIFIRSVGWRRVAEQEVELYDEETIAQLQAFADGVNAYIMGRDPGDLALEYSILGLIGINFEIKPWTPADSLVFAKIMSWVLGFRRCEEETRATLYELIGEEMTDQWIMPPWPFGKKPTIVQPEDLSITEASLISSLDRPPATQGSNALTAKSILPDMSLVFGQGYGIGSNNWVVSGDLTESGMPLLANDPHLGIQIPSIWYQIGLHLRPANGESPFSVTGFTFAATPGVVIGHNGYIAWGVTNVGPDVHDLYRIRINPDNPLQYEWNGKWRDMTLHEETIFFGDGQEPITILVRETHLGPIINDNQMDEETGKILGFNNEDPLALRWTALEPGTLVRAIVELNKATNWEEFRGALQYWDVPGQNFVYADVEGNIGYQMTGRIPIRAENHSGLLPAPGWTDEFEWQGFIPFELLPRIFNPERGYIVTANQAVVPLEFYDQLARQLGVRPDQVIISHEWNYGYRAQRIVKMLDEKAPHTIASFQSILGDNKLISAEELMPYLAGLRFDNPELANARDWLLEWDYRFDIDSPQAALYAQFWARLMHYLFIDQLGEDVQVRGGSREIWATFLLMEQPDNAWWDYIATEEVVETRDDILIRSFSEGYANTVAALGKNRDDWRWGELHTSYFVSTPLGMSGIGLIEDMVNRGPFATSGSTGTVNNTVWDAGAGDFSVSALPSMRMIIDLADLSQSVAIHTTGQSGHPYSRHYDDMIDTWLNMEYNPMLWTREDIEAAAVNRLILHPGG